jgi:hypothetical protein
MVLVMNYTKPKSKRLDTPTLIEIEAAIWTLLVTDGGYQFFIREPNNSSLLPVVF